MHAEPPARLLVIGTHGRAGNSSTTPTRPTTCSGLGLHRLPTGGFPLLRSLAPVLASCDGAIDLGRGLDIVLPGLTAALTPRGPSAPPARTAHPGPE